MQFEPKQLIEYTGPGTYAGARVFMATRIWVKAGADTRHFTYSIKDGTIDATVAADGSGSMNLTDWKSETGEKITVKITWTCTDW